MRKALLDTCTLIDFAIKERPRHAATVKTLEQLQSEGYVFCVLASSIKDTYYLLGRQLHDEPLARLTAKKLKETFTLFELTEEIVDTAFESDEPDFEDGLVRAAAENCRCELIVTADKAAFTASSVDKLLVEDSKENAANLEARYEAENGIGKTFTNAEDLMTDLNN